MLREVPPSLSIPSPTMTSDLQSSSSRRINLLAFHRTLTDTVTTHAYTFRLPRPHWHAIFASPPRGLICPNKRSMVGTNNSGSESQNTDRLSMLYKSSIHSSLISRKTDVFESSYRHCVSRQYRPRPAFRYFVETREDAR
jgi:hypothetical protein